MTTAPVHALTEEEYAGHLNWRLWWRVLRHYVLPYAKYLLPLIAVAGLTGACEVRLTLTMARTIDAAANGNTHGLGMGVLLYGSLAVALGVLVFVLIRLAGKSSLSIAHDIRRDVFAKLQELHFAYYDQRPIGWLMARGTTDCQRIGRLFAWGLMDLTWGFLMMVFMAGTMFQLSWWLALAVFVVVPPMVVLSKIFTRRILFASRAVRRTNSIMTASYNEAITAVKTTKTLVREDRNFREFQDLSTNMYRQSVHRAMQSAIYFPLVFGLAGVAGGLALWLGGLGVLAGPFTLGPWHVGPLILGPVVLAKITIGTLVFFITATRQFFGPVHETARVITDLYGAQASAERVMSLLETETLIKDSPEVAAAITAHAGRERPAGVAVDGLPERIGEIRFQNVSFAYKPDQPVLTDFNLTIQAGQTLALVGPTGGGKTTVVSLLCRFYEPTAGQILLDGVDYRQRSLRWLQENLGIVLQTPHLFSGTIRENIRYGRLDATDEDVVWAAKLVRADRFITELEHGYDSDVGEGGGRLSTGQKQLVALARAILADPQVLVMDEATSSVDTETERLIQEAIENVLRRRTSVVVAHRLSTIRSADRILVIDAGRIIEDGNHHELICRRGRYYELYTNQFTADQQAQLLGEAQRLRDR